MFQSSVCSKCCGVSYSSRLSRLQPWICKESAEFHRLEEVQYVLVMLQCLYSVETDSDCTLLRTIMW